MMFRLNMNDIKLILKGLANIMDISPFFVKYKSEQLITFLPEKLLRKLIITVFILSSREEFEAVLLVALIISTQEK